MFMRTRFTANQPIDLMGEAKALPFRARNMPCVLGPGCKRRPNAHLTFSGASDRFSIHENLSLHLDRLGEYYWYCTQSLAWRGVRADTISPYGTSVLLT